MTDVENFNNQSLGEEIANAITHGIGAIVSIIGLVLLILKAIVHSSISGVVAAAIYGASLVILYTMSTLYHSLTNRKAKKVFRAFDHCSIFVLITGTYAPFCLITLQGVMGWSLLGFNIALTIIGVILNAIDIKRWHKLSLFFYLLMGWSIVVAFKPLMQRLDIHAMILIAIGGLCYTLGVIFYVAKKPKYMHAIWHMFVLAGSVTQYLAMLFYVI